MSEQVREVGVGFEDPPPKRTQRYDWEAIATQLRRKPMKWYKVFDQAKTSIATAIRIDGIKVLQPVVKKGHPWGFEVRTTNNDRGNPEDGVVRTCTLFLRYVPEGRSE
jgi:hypothetical protein